jgi:hypothetical protein
VLWTNNISVTEGSGAAVNASFIITLYAPSGKTVSINAITANGTAKAPAHYTNTGTTLAAHQFTTGVSKSCSV